MNKLMFVFERSNCFWESLRNHTNLPDYFPEKQSLQESHMRFARFDKCLGILVGDIQVTKILAIFCLHFKILSRYFN